MLMTVSVNNLWQDDMPLQLSQTMARITDEQAMRNFLRDVMTEKEIAEISARLEAARMLRNGETYVAVITKTRLSSRTVARISQWLQSGTTGYTTALDTIDSHHDHIPPARA